GNESHLALEFGRTEIRIRSLLGYVDAEYPRGWAIPFNRKELEPWWGAWQPWLLAGAGAAVVFVLLISWAMLAAIYSLPAWLIAFVANRELTLRGGWRLAAAAQMPGALFMAATILAYGFGVIDLVRLGAGFGFHLLLGWICVFVSTFFLPRHPA